MYLPDFKAFIFDMDGVLVDSEPFYMAVEQKNFKSVGLNISGEEHLRYQGVATDVMWKELKAKYLLSQSVDELVASTLSEVVPYFESLDKIEPMPGVEKLLQFLYRQNVPLALASSSFPEVIEIIMKKTGLAPVFNHQVSSKMAGESKPSPAIFLLTAKMLGVLPGQCIVVEDSTNGIRAAKRAGMFCIAYAGPGSAFQNQAEADLIVRDFEEITNLLKTR